ncbi:MAG: hypothetical protein VKJ02_15145 [Snowella sp.]|nr:hypothetical protein [Snowella sp.]
MRRFLSILLICLLSITTVACGGGSTPTQAIKTAPKIENQISSGRYPVQQATYDDSDGVYSLMLLNTPAGTPPTYRTDKLQMARLSDEDIKKGEKTSVQINGDQAEMYLTEDFKIEYVHNVTETVENPQTGQPETVVVRRESNFWTPFAGALAGQALGSLLFRPQYYVPPMYSGGPLTGYGGYGSSYGQAVNTYRSRYNSAPTVEKNRQTLRTTGNIRKYPSSTSNKAVRKPNYNSTKSSGSGFGSSRLKSSGSSSSSSSRMKRSSGFGSSSGMRSRSSGRRR